MLKKVKINCSVPTDEITTRKKPIFKVCAELEIWISSDPTPRPSLRILEESISFTCLNRCDIKALVKSSVFGKLAKLGVDTTKLDYQFMSADFLVSMPSNDFLGYEPKWSKAYDGLAEPVNDSAREEAIKKLTYLPYDLKEQIAVYGAD